MAFQVARRLGAPLEVWVVRKLGTPGREELAMGAIAAGGGRVLNQGIVDSLQVSADTLAAVEQERSPSCSAASGCTAATGLSPT